MLNIMRSRQLGTAALLLSMAIPVVNLSGDPPLFVVDHPIAGYFFAGSEIEDPRALGGYGKSGNLPHLIDREVQDRRVSLTAFPDERLELPNGYLGFVVVLANATRRQVNFPAQDSRLSIVLEALAPDGEWRPVEFIPQVWCGNSFHRVFLPPGHAWTFTVPHYGGDFETKLRYVMLDDDLIRSNEFVGSINLSQLIMTEEELETRMRDYYGALVVPSTFDTSRTPLFGHYQLTGTIYSLEIGESSQ